MAEIDFAAAMLRGRFADDPPRFSSYIAHRDYPRANNCPFHFVKRRRGSVYAIVRLNMRTGGYLPLRKINI